jgi:hypothetical protein
MARFHLGTHKRGPETGKHRDSDAYTTPHWSAAGRASLRQETRHASPGVVIFGCATRRSIPLSFLE